MPVPDTTISEQYSRANTFAAELVSDISQDARMVRTSGIPVPCSLPCAVESQFLSIVEKEKWWETLELIRLSRQGCHGVLCLDNSDTCPGSNSFPLVASSALIQSIPETDVADENTLLTRDPLFRGRVWAILADKRSLTEQLRLYADALERNSSGHLTIAVSEIPENPAENSELEEGIIRAVGAENITELLRLTGDDANRFKYSYQGLKHFSALQAARGILLSFGVAYENLANIFEVLGRLSGEPCYIRLSECRLKSYEPKTQKILLLNENLSRAMGANSWRRVAMLLQKTNRSCP